jgi:WD40 repeat protein
MPIDYTKIKELHAEKQGRGMLSCRFDPTGKIIAAGGMNGQITRCILAEEKLSAPVHAPGHLSWVSALAWHPQGRWLYAGDHGGRIVAWDMQAETPQIVWTQDAHRGWIRSVAVSPDGRYVASAGNDKIIRVWTSMDSRKARDLIGHAEHIYSLAFHPSGQFLVSGDIKGNLKQWDVETGQVVRELVVKEMFVQQQQLRLGGVRCLSFSRDGKWIVCGGMSGFGSIGDGIGAPTVMLLDWESGEAKQTGYPKEAARTFVMGAAAHTDGLVIAATGGLDRGYVLVWKIGQTEKESAFQFKLPESAWGMDLNAAENRIVTAHHDGNLRLYELPPA